MRSHNINLGKLYANEHDEILVEIMDRIEEREVWIPYGEVKRYYLSKIGSRLDLI